jgi:hypothetical protein
MTMTDTTLGVLLWGGLGSLLFTGLLLLMRSIGVTDAARDREGKFRRMTWKSLVGFASVLTMMVGFPALGSATILEGDISLWAAWGVAYGIFFVVNLYDFVVLDYLLIVRWHPAFLNLPDTDYYKTTRPHAAGFARGTVMGIPATLVSAGLAIALT